MPQTNRYDGASVLVTGGLGFIGSNLAHRLVTLGARVTLLDSLRPECGGNEHNAAGIRDRIAVEIGDVRDHDRLDRLVRGMNVVFNLAGTASHTDSMADPYTDLDINCRAQIALLEACRNHNSDAKVVFTGTRGQYGRPERLPVDERHPLAPADANGINKSAGEQYHLLYHRYYGLRTTSLRLSNTYGPRHQMKHPRQGVICWFVRQVLDGRPIRVYGDGKQVRDTNYVDDVVEALCRAGASAEADGEVFNLGGTPVGLADLACTLIRIAGRGNYELAEYPAASRGVEVGDYVADTRKIEQRLGWKAAVPLEEGLRRTLEFYEKEKSHYWE
ncbi:MAG: NAD-dependent epimerase/dehydratase family protein [Deltaproteobacteria bacterium]|nr:NAD-dependent epimerase/dehydratase family protein [Deltaproteobacteria bacterium]